MFVTGIAAGVALGLLLAWGIVEAAGLGEFLRAGYRGHVHARRRRRRTRRG